MAYMMAGRSRDPRDVAPVGVYMTDSNVLVQIVDCDATYALGQDVCSDALYRIGVVDLMARWRRAKPASDADVAERMAGRRA
jgi:hypothetical protein